MLALHINGLPIADEMLKSLIMHPFSMSTLSLNVDASLVFSMSYSSIENGLVLTVTYADVLLPPSTVWLAPVPSVPDSSASTRKNGCASSFPSAPHTAMSPTPNFRNEKSHTSNVNDALASYCPSTCCL